MRKGIILIGIPKNVEKNSGVFVIPEDADLTFFYLEMPKQIRLFFVKYLEYFVDDFTEESVSEHKIPKVFFEMLADNIEVVLEDFSKAPDLLPVSGNEYVYNPADFDERYFLELERTSKDIRKIFNVFDFKKDDVYYMWLPMH